MEVQMIDAQILRLSKYLSRATAHLIQFEERAASSLSAHGSSSSSIPKALCGLKAYTYDDSSMTQMQRKIPHRPSTTDNPSSYAMRCPPLTGRRVEAEAANKATATEILHQRMKLTLEHDRAECLLRHVTGWLAKQQHQCTY